jgi:hypothetical protein
MKSLFGLHSSSSSSNSSNSSNSSSAMHLRVFDVEIQLQKGFTGLVEGKCDELLSQTGQVMMMIKAAAAAVVVMVVVVLTMMAISQILHITPHTSHITRHTSHITRHTSHVVQVFLITPAVGFDGQNIRIRSASELLSSGSLMSSRVMMVQ